MTTEGESLDAILWQLGHATNFFGVRENNLICNVAILRVRYSEPRRNALRYEVRGRRLLVEVLMRASSYASVGTGMLGLFLSACEDNGQVISSGSTIPPSTGGAAANAPDAMLRAPGQ
jgi:hypothetical protein